MAGDRKRGFIRPDEDDALIEPQRWGLPDYGDSKEKKPNRLRLTTILAGCQTLTSQKKSKLLN